MLASLHIQNVVLIDRISIEFQAGLCALTGETGAGKSILLDALGLALGARSESGIVRKGTEQASVSAVFDLAPDHPVWSFLKEQGLEVPDALVLRRVVTAEGRSRAFVSDQPVSAGLLKQVGEYLVEVHGQFETQGLLNVHLHREMLDAFGVDSVLQESLKKVWQDWREKDAATKALRVQIEKNRAEEEFIRQALEDLDELSPEAGEEEKLTVLRDRLMKGVQYLEGFNTADQALTQMQHTMGVAWRALEKLGSVAKKTLEGMGRVSAEIEEVLHTIRAAFSDLEDPEISLQEIDDRLYALKNMARKHGCSMEELIEKRAIFAQTLNEMEYQDDVLQDHIRQSGMAKKQYQNIAEKMSEARKNSAQKLDVLVMQELGPLKLDQARFVTMIEQMDEPDWNENGMERVQFLVATNPRSAAGPIHKIASGGELARFMLALKVVLAEVGVMGTMVFDEVDSGIGGAVADAVGERLARLAGAKSVQQILVVTHSPQVAARASSHYIVQKNAGAEVKTEILPLDTEEARREEIARMLSGARITPEARAAANKLLEQKIA